MLTACLGKKIYLERWHTLSCCVQPPSSLPPRATLVFPLLNWSWRKKKKTQCASLTLVWLRATLIRPVIRWYARRLPFPNAYPRQPALWQPPSWIVSEASHGDSQMTGQSVPREQGEGTRVTATLFRVCALAGWQAVFAVGLSAGARWRWFTFLVLR